MDEIYLSERYSYHRSYRYSPTFSSAEEVAIGILQLPWFHRDVTRFAIPSLTVTLFKPGDRMELNTRRRLPDGQMQREVLAAMTEGMKADGRQIKIEVNGRRY
jgi:hypothetical protein